MHEGDSIAIIEFLRIVVLIVMLGAASYFDVSNRKIPDMIWLVFGGFGAILYIFDWQSVTSYHMLSMIVAGAVALLLHLYRLTGAADIFAILGIAVILPVSYGFVMVPTTILIGAGIIVTILISSYNVILNVLDLAKSKTSLFEEFAEPRHRKFFAFFATHRKRRWEKFVVVAESLSFTNTYKKSFVFFAWKRSSVPDKSPTTHNQNIMVQNIPPFVVYLFGVSLLLLLPQIIHLFFIQ